uniref:TROVE domain-containing protein n=1 Tax=Acrobeloides nanus TaxID=290746 RepID=A0A914CMH2_9BILA
MVRVEQSFLENIQESIRLLQLLDTPEVNYEPAQIPGQMLKTRDDEVQNSAGGYVFQVSDVTLIRRFLILGTSGGTYYSTEKQLTINNLERLVRIIKDGKGGLIIREILEISLAGRAPKQEPTMFALALCARYDVKDRVSKLKKMKQGEPPSEEEEAEIKFDDYIVQLHKAAFHAVSKVCRIPTHLFMFVKFCKMIPAAFDGKSSGWGRMMRKAIASWYLNKDPKS